MIANRDLTARQRELYDFILTHLAEKGSQPTQAEMMKHMLVSSPNSIEGMLASMERKGYVQRTGRARSMKILRREH
jgi:SOS-response transcriptional repressor LexA